MFHNSLKDNAELDIFAKQMNVNQLKLGILGGGQLGRMLIQKAMDYDIHISVLDGDKECSCKNMCDEFTLGNINDYQTVIDFGKKQDLITIEIEHVNVDALDELQRLGIKVFPQPQVIRTVQDKGKQKLFYQKNNIPSSDFFLVENKSEIINGTFGFPFVQKLRKSGYDGKGVVKLSSEKELEKAFDAPSVIEKLEEIEKEISIIISRNEKREIAVFPAVELVFNEEANLVDYLFSPANISAEQENEARKISEKIITSLDMVGLLAVEFFITKKGKILVNEIAPRPHNSGHHTIEANITSQYDQHLRAIVGLPPGSTKIISPAVMINLLGEKGFEGEAKVIGLEEILGLESVYLHLYGKKFTRPFRKMGHVTILGEAVKNAMEKANEVKSKIKICGTKISS